MSDFTALRAEVRANESSTDSLLAQYSELVHEPPMSTNELEQQIEQALLTRQASIRELSALSYGPNATPTMQRQADRHQITLNDHKTTFKRLRTAINQERSRRSLLSSVRQDIQSHRESQNAQNMSTDSDAENTAYYTNEMRRVDHSRSIADSLLTSAYEARSELQRQQRLIGDVQKRMLSVLSRVPGVNTLISKINTRQKRNSLFLATLIVLGVLFIVFVR